LEFRRVLFRSPGGALAAAVTGFFDGTPRPTLSAAGAQLRSQLTNHIESGTQLARNVAQRAQWLDGRHAALDRVQRRIASAGGAGLAINGTQVVAERSLSELASAINGVRGNFAAPAEVARREQA